MRIFKFFKIKESKKVYNKIPMDTQTLSNKLDVAESESNNSTENFTVNKYSKVNIPNNKSLTVKGLTIHEDIRDLIWIAEGNYKNYKQKQEKDDIYNINGFRISYLFEIKKNIV